MFEQIGTVLERVLEEQRARVPVRRRSFERGRCEGTFWKKTSRQEVRCILFAAKRYELAFRRSGRRCGPLGSVAIEVLEYFANLVDFRTGRLEPSLDTLMRRLRRSRDAIVRALRNLRTHGFLDWLRRYMPTGNEGRGPQLRQSSNAYRLSLPERAKQILGWRGLPELLPADCEHAGGSQSGTGELRKVDLPRGPGPVRDRGRRVEAKPRSPWKECQTRVRQTGRVRI